MRLQRDLRSAGVLGWGPSVGQHGSGVAHATNDQTCHASVTVTGQGILDHLIKSVRKRQEDSCPGKARRHCVSIPRILAVLTSTPGQGSGVDCLVFV